MADPSERRKFLPKPWRQAEIDEEQGSDEDGESKLNHRASSTGSLAFKVNEASNKSLSLPKEDPIVKINQELKDAIEASDENAVSACLFSKGADPNFVFEPANHGTCLHLASEIGNKNIVELLVKAGADVNTTDARGITPIHAAAGAGMVSVIELLAESGAALDATDWAEIEDDKQDMPPQVTFESKVNKGDGIIKANETLVSFLTGTKANNSKDKVKTSNKAKEGRRETPLHRAARKCQEMAVRKLISLGAEVNALEGQGRTPLHLAVQSGSVGCIKVLIENNANPNANDKRGAAPITFLGESFLARINKDTKQYFESLDSLIKAGAKVNVHNPETGCTPLLQATTLGQLEAVQLLLTSGSCLTAFDNEQSTPLHACCLKGHSKILKLLLDQPAARTIINSPDSTGHTPLHKAANRSSTECIQLLLKSGADLGLKTKSGVSAITLILQLPKGPNVLSGLFDESIKTNGIDPSEFNCHLKFDYSILISKHKSQQMNVIEDILDNRHEQRTADLFQHPLIASFLFLKWRKVRMLFFSSVITYIILVAGITADVWTALSWDKWLAEGNKLNGTVSEIAYNSSANEGISSNNVNVDTPPNLRFQLSLIFVVVIIIFQEVIQFASMPLQYFQEAESYVKWGNLVASSVLVFQPIPWAEWVHFVAAWAVLFGWAEVTFLLGRLPTFGVYALMFYAVAQHLAKFILVFFFFLAGFSFSFQIIFMKHKEAFANPWTALLRTLAMMAGDVSYDDYMTEGNNSIPITAHLIYFLFIMLVGLVLMNLLIGLAVSDIQGLQKEGNVKRLRKQAQFIVYLEDVVNNRVFRFLLCKNFVDKVNLWINQKPQFLIHPAGRNQKIRLPTDVVEDALAIAHEGKKLTVKSTLNDTYNLVHECATSIGSLSKRIEKIETGLSELKQIIDCESTEPKSKFANNNGTTEKLISLESDVKDIKGLLLKMKAIENKSL